MLQLTLRLEAGTSKRSLVWYPYKEVPRNEVGVYVADDGRVDNIVNNVRALVTETGWTTDRAFDVLHVSPEDRVVVVSRL